MHYIEPVAADAATLTHLGCAVCGRLTLLPVRLHRLVDGACDAVCCRLCVAELGGERRDCPRCGQRPTLIVVGVDPFYSRLLEHLPAVCERCGATDGPLALLRHGGGCDVGRAWHLLVHHPTGRSCEALPPCRPGHCVLVQFVLDCQADAARRADAEWMVDRWLQLAMASGPTYVGFPVFRQLMQALPQWFCPRWLRLNPKPLVASGGVAVAAS